MASVVMEDAGMMPTIAVVRSLAALMSASYGAIEGIVRYLCLKNTELQVQVLFVSVM